MTALAAAKQRNHKEGDVQSHLMSAQKIWAGALVMLDSTGYARNALAGASNRGCVGIAQETVDNSGGSAGDLKIKVSSGRFLLSGTGFTQALVGAPVYASDNDTVSPTQGTNEPAVGVILDYVSSTSAWVLVGEPALMRSLVAPVIQLLSFDLDLADIANGNLITGYPMPFAGTILSFRAISTKPPTTAAKLSTLNLELAGTNVTGGSLALTSASLATLGTVQEATAITAANTFAAGALLDVEAASTTTFVEGRVKLEITIQRSAQV